MKTITYQYHEGSSEQYGLFRQPAGDVKDRPLIVFIHGGFWREAVDMTYFTPLVEAVTKLGYPTWQIEYERLSPGNDAPTVLTSILNALDFIPQIEKNEQLSFNRIILVGHSVGAQLAIWAVKQNQLTHLPFDHVISLAGVLDLDMMSKVHTSKENMKHIDYNPVKDFLGPSYKALMNDVSPIALLPIRYPQTVIHGQMDIEVPIGLTMTYYEKAKEMGETIQLVVDEVADHYWIVNPEHPSGQRVVDIIQSIAASG